MLKLRDVLNPADRAHLVQILGGREEPTEETQRRTRVSQYFVSDTYLEDAGLDAFKALSQGDRERLISDVVWRITCHVEGSITDMSGHAFGLENGFKLVMKKEDGRTKFCVVRKAT